MPTKNLTKLFYYSFLFRNEIIERLSLEDLCNTYMYGNEIKVPIKDDIYSD